MGARAVDILPHAERVIELEDRSAVGFRQVHHEALRAAAGRHGVGRQLLAGRDEVVGAHVDASVGAAASGGRRRERCRAAVAVLRRHVGTGRAVVPQQLAAAPCRQLGSHQDSEEVARVELVGADAHVGHCVEHGERGRRAAGRYPDAAHQLPAGIRLEQLAEVSECYHAVGRPEVLLEQLDAVARDGHQLRRAGTARNGHVGHCRGEERAAVE